MSAIIIAVDFDGTLCTDMYPQIGVPRKEIIEFVKKRKASGAKLILWTCRSGIDLVKATVWCIEQGIKFDAINENLPENIEKYGNDTRKIYADVYIDDKSITPNLAVMMD